MTRMAWIALTALCCGCGAGANRTAAPQAHHPVVLTLASATEPEPLEAYAQMVERLSAGTLLVRIVSREDNGYPEPERGYIADARAGRIDLGAVSSRAWGDAGAPSFDALNAPLLIDSLALEGAVLRSGIVTPMLRSLHPLGFAGIAVLPGPLRRPLGITRPLIRPVDYRGLRISVTPSRVASATMRAVGATPVDRDYNKPLRRMDALEGHVGTIEINSFDAGGGYLTTNVALAARPVVVFAAARRFTSLTPAQRDILARAGTAIASSQLQQTAVSERDQAAVLCRRGRLHYVTGDVAALRRAVEPVYRALERDPATASALAATTALKTRTARPTDTVPACGASRPAPAMVRTPFDGVYRMVTSIAHDADDDPTAVPENYGVWTFVFTRGHFAITQEDSPACTWGYGTYTVTGDRIDWRFTDGGGIAPNHAANKPGEDFAFRWNRYHDTLTLGPPKGGWAPDNFFLRPWRRIATAPTRRYFAKRCPPPAAALPR